MTKNSVVHTEWISWYSASAGRCSYQLVACSLTPEASPGAFDILHHAEKI